MITVLETEGFAKWLRELKDMPTRLRLGRRLDKARRGIFGDVESAGDGVFEMREHFGPGWRMYYIKQGGAVIVMLGGGDKATQRRDIERAGELALELRNEQDQDPSV